MARRDEDEEVTQFWSGRSFLEGSLGGDPEDRSRDGDGSFVTVSLAVNNRNYRGENGTIWYNLVIRGNMAKNVLDSLRKGQRVMVEGRLEDATFENKDGEEVTRIALIVDSIGPSLRFNVYGEPEPGNSYNDDDDEDERPRRKKKSSGGRKKSRSRDDDYDDEDVDDEDDDDEEEERPRRSRSRSSSKSRSGGSSRRRSSRRDDDDDDDWDEED